MNTAQAKYYKQQLDIKNKDYERNLAYYMGANPSIMNNKNLDEYSRLKAQDRRIPLPMARKLINTLCGFTFADIEYKETGKSLNNIIDFTNLMTEVQKEIKTEEKTDYMKYVETIFKRNDNDILTLETAISACNHGRAYKIYYFADKMLYFDVIPSNQILPIYTDTLNPALDKAMRFYEENNVGEDGKEKCIYHIDIYSADKIEKYQGEKEDYSDMALSKDQGTPQEIKKIHIVEYNIFRDKSPLVAFAYGMIDEADRVISKNMAEELAGVKGAILKLSASLDKQYKDEQGKTAYDRFQETNIIENSYKEDIVEWVTKQIQDSFIFGVYDRLKKDIFELCDIPNFSDGESWGNTISGVSAGYRLLGFIFLADSVFRTFSEGLRAEIDLINAYADLLAGNGPVKASMNELDIIPKRHLPRNLYENAQIAGLLKGIVSKKTLYGLFPELVTNPDQESDASEDEAEAETNRLVNGLKETPPPENEEEAKEKIA